MEKLENINIVKNALLQTENFFFLLDSQYRTFGEL